MSILIPLIILAALLLYLLLFLLYPKTKNESGKQKAATKMTHNSVNSPPRHPLRCSYLRLPHLALSCILASKLVLANSQEQQQQPYLVDQLLLAETLGQHLHLQLKQPKENERKLAATYSCNEEIAVISPSETSDIMTTFITNISPANLLLFQIIVGNQLKYGVQVKTICAKCSDVNIQDLTSSYPNLSQEHWDKYCGSDVYGYDYDHSGLVMIPLTEDGTGQLVVPDGTLPGYVHSRQTSESRWDIPSQMWATDGNHDNYNLLLPFLATATKGTVSFAPDTMGYGHSEAFMGYTIRNAYLTSFLPLWVTIGNELSEGSNCKTVLGDAAFLTGYSEGGSASVTIAEGLNKALNVDIVQVRAGGVASDLVATMKHIVANYEQLKGYWGLTILFAASYSSTNPDVPNYSVGQDLLSVKYGTNAPDPNNNMVQWLKELPLTEVTQRIMAIESSLNEGKTINDEIMSESFLTFFQGAIDDGETNPCSPTYSGYQVGVVDKMCEAMLQNSLTETLNEVKYPVALCHGQSDELLPYFPDISQNPNYLSLQQVPGDHNAAGEECISNDILYLLVSTTFQQYVIQDKHSENGSCPTASSNCKDSTVKFQTKLSSGKPVWKYCKWVQSRATKSRCKLENVKESCSETCSAFGFALCENNCADTMSKLKFVKNGKKIARKCAWVTKKKNVRCLIDGLKEACRKSCEVC